MTANTHWPGAATLTAELTQGVPHQLAVIVDGTNFASPFWQPYVSSNLTVDLPADGWHDVWVALAGRVPVGEPRWHWRRLKRDTAPPVLTITNAPLTPWPLLQIHGWSDEDLRSLSYSLGAVTNERVFVRDRHYAAATHEFTTNYFQACDVELMPGTNVCQQRATDRAGNVTETNFPFVLEADTTAPALTFAWPRPGARIAADTVTVRGWLDDPTARLTAEWVERPGQTNACEALVERHGRFWLRGLPLSAGTNQFILKAVDAWTNTLVTNLTLVRGTLTVTADSPVRFPPSSVSPVRCVPQAGR